MTIEDRIIQLKQEKQALILAHNYQDVAVQDIADFRGDSLQLSILASQSEAKLIVFCGVRFMAETAAILNPGARVLLPVADAGCPMADMITGEQLRRFKAEHPGCPVVCYVNSSVEVKAESDICCTSSNAVRVLASFPPDQAVIFVPDCNLGRWAGKQSKRKVILWEGFCPIHQWGFNATLLKALRRKHPDFALIAHPECDEDIIDQADEVLSTGGMMSYVETHDKLIIATDAAFVDYLRHIFPGKQLVALSNRARCKNMRKTKLEHLLQALETGQHLVEVSPEVATGALKALRRMLEL